MSDQPRDEGALRARVPRVLAGLVRRGEDFDAAEDVADRDRAAPQPRPALCGPP